MIFIIFILNFASLLTSLEETFYFRPAEIEVFSNILSSEHAVGFLAYSSLSLELLL